MSKSLAVLVLLAFAAGILSADVIQVLPGDGTLKTAVEQANNGDVLVLQSGGLYTISNERALMIEKRLIIKAEDGATIRPMIKMIVPSDSLFDPHFFMLKDGSSLQLHFIELNGQPADTATHNTANVFVRPEENASIGHIHMMDCFLHDAQGNVVDGDVSGASVDSVIMDQCVVGNCRGGPEFDTAALKGLMKVTNSTFWNLTNRFLRAQPGGGDAQGIVDHCTVYNVAGKRIIMAKDNSKPWRVTNSIFSTFTGSSPLDCIRPGSNAADTLANCILHSNVGLHKDWNVVRDTSHADPQFKDPVNGDFTLLANSPALTMADDGGAIGDLRWAGSTAVHDHALLPAQFILGQNYPNPFNPETTISFTLAEKGYTNLSVLNVAGQVVTVLIDREMQVGPHRITFNAENLASGIYYYKLSTGQQTAVRKMLLIR